MTQSTLPIDRWHEAAKGNNDLYRYANAPYEAVIATEAGYTVADLHRSRLRLQKNQWIAGYCHLIARSAVTDLHQMRDHERQLFMSDLILAAEAIQQVYRPFTINYVMDSIATAHLHVQIIPRYINETALQTPLNPDQSTVYLDRDDYTDAVGNLREAMGFIRNRVHDPNLTNVLDNQGRVVDWPSRKHTDQQMALRLYLADKFEIGRTYNEREINAILNQWALFEDWALLRRELIMYKLLQRHKDGSAYWRVDDDADEA